MASIDTQSIINRAKAIITSPRTEWPVIEAESTDIPSIYRNYLLILAAIAPIATFIGFSIIGFGFGGVTIRTGFFAGLVQAVVSFGLTLVMFYVIALVIDALAPKFGGQANLVNAFKVVAYGSTAAMVAGVLYIIPSLSMLVFFASLYALYTIYLGLPVLMKCPQDKALGYTVVVVLCGVVAGILLAILSSCFRPSPTKMGAGDGGSISINTPKGEVVIDQKKMDEVARKLEEASKRMEAATKPAADGKPVNPAEAGKAVSEALGALAGMAGGREPASASMLKDLLPEALGDLKRESFETKDGAAMGLKGSMAEAVYRQGERKVEIKLADTGGLAGLIALAGWVNVTGEKDNPNEFEKIYKQGNRTVREHLSKGSKDVEYSLVLANGVMVEVEAQGVDLAGAKKIAEALPLAKLEAIGQK